MAQTKKKTQTETSKKLSGLLNVLGNDGVQAEPEPTGLWQSEIEGLLGQSFKSLGDVIDAIADNVCRRIGGAIDEELHQLIVTMLDTDVEIREELAELFKVPADFHD
jgi:hypothetical protein